MVLLGLRWTQLVAVPHKFNAGRPPIIAVPTKPTPARERANPRGL